MPTSTKVTDLKINELTEAQYDTAVQQGIIGANELSILTDAEAGQVIQVATLPTAAAGELDKIYQFIGTTDANYTNGYFYKCVSDGQDPATYSWTQTDVQPQAGGLPDQTGNAGKFLITNGTTAEWGAKLPASVLSTDSYGKGYQLVRYGTTGLKVTCTWDNYGSTRGYYVFDANTFWGYYDAYSRPKLGDYNHPWSIVYASSLSNGQNNTITIPATAGVMAVQVTTVPTAGSTYVGQIYQYIGATDSTYTHGYIYECKAQGTDPETYAWEAVEVQAGGGGGGSTALSLTLAAADWSNNTITVTATGVTASNNVIVSPAPASQSAYTTAGVMCTAQASDSLTFTCTTTPSSDLTVTVLII